MAEEQLDQEAEVQEAVAENTTEDTTGDTGEEEPVEATETPESSTEETE